MKKHLLWIIPCISVLLLGITMPLSENYYGMHSTLERLLFIITFYGFPIWFFLPVGLFASIIAIFSYRKLSYKKRLFKWTKTLFIIVSVFFLFINGSFTVSKFIFGNDPFPRQYYDELIATTQDLSAIKNGVFKMAHGKIIRKGDSHLVEYDNGDSVAFQVNWLDNGEHQLIHQYPSNEGSDTLLVKVTAITDDYYECYYKLGELAGYDKIEIIK